MEWGLWRSWPDAANLAGGSPAGSPGLIIQDGRCGRGGKTVPLRDEEPRMAKKCEAIIRSSSSPEINDFQERM